MEGEVGGDDVICHAVLHPLEAPDMPPEAHALDLPPGEPQQHGGERLQALALGARCVDAEEGGGEADRDFAQRSKGPVRSGEWRL